MSGPQSFNAEQFKLQQRQIWDNAARGWQDWWQTFEHGAQQVSDKLVQLAGIVPGHTVLDIATGIGEPAITAAMRVKPDGRIVATDLSLQMISIAKSRAHSLGLDGVIEFREIDAEKLDFPESSFDAVLSRWGLMFIPDLAAALLKIRTFLIPQGRLAAATWAAPSKVPLLDVAFSTVRKQMGSQGPPPVLGPFSLADSEALKRSFVQAGYKDVNINTITSTFAFDSAASYTTFQQQIAAPIQVMLASFSEEKKKQVWDAMTEAVSSYADSHGRVNMDNEVICVVGTK